MRRRVKSNTDFFKKMQAAKEKKMNAEDRTWRAKRKMSPEDKIWHKMSDSYRARDHEERTRNKIAYMNEYKELPPDTISFWNQVEHKQRERPGTHATKIAHDLLHQPPKRKKAMIPGNYKHIKRTTARAARSAFTNRGAMFDW